MPPSVLIASTRDVDDHDTSPGHPERASRLPAVEKGLEAAHLGEAVGRITPQPAERSDLLRVHTAEYIDRVSRFVEAGGGDLDPDTTTSPGSWATALFAAGAGLRAIDCLYRGHADAAFVAVRPPGHHATSDRAMGFCLINNVAVAAAALADRGERVVILDWDVHHGNGTQDIFWDDPRVLYGSTHQWPCYPGTGRPEETGGPAAPGLTINVPLPPGATGDVARAAIDDVIAPAVDAFSPTWVLISAGFDAHRADPLASLEWSAGDFADLTATVAGWAPKPGRLIAFLEGGYDLDALGRSAAATVATMAGQRYRPEEATSGGPGRDLVAALAARRASR